MAEVALNDISGPNVPIQFSHTCIHVQTQMRMHACTEREGEKTREKRGAGPYQVVRFSVSKPVAKVALDDISMDAVRFATVKGACAGLGTSLIVDPRVLET
jgi:hypothetical protein